LGRHGSLLRRPTLQRTPPSVLSPESRLPGLGAPASRRRFPNCASIPPLPSRPCLRRHRLLPRPKITVRPSRRRRLPTGGGRTETRGVELWLVDRQARLPHKTLGGRLSSCCCFVPNASDVPFPFIPKASIGALIGAASTAVTGQIHEAMLPTANPASSCSQGVSHDPGAFRGFCRVFVRAGVCRLRSQATGLVPSCLGA